MDKYQGNSKDRVISICSLIISILTLIIMSIALIYGEGIYTDFKKQQEFQNEKQKETQENYLLLAEEYESKGDYEAVAGILTKDVLENNPYALLNLGVMHANGDYYMQDDEVAKDYFYMALKNGEEYYSIMYLLSILDASEGKDGKDELNRIFIKGCNNNNQHCEKLLQYLYAVNDYEANTSCLLDFNSKTDKEKEEILDNFYHEIGSYKQWAVKSYKYYIEEKNGEVEVSAEADEIIETEFKVIVAPLFNHEYIMRFR